MAGSPIVDELQRVIAIGGVPAVLSFLNKRTPHRFTGIYRYDGAVLRNLALCDRSAPDLRRGDDVSMRDAYCALVQEARMGGQLVFDDARTDSRQLHKPGTPVVSYCGVLLRDERGEPFGTLCHFDVQRCEAPAHDIATLRAAAPILFAFLRGAGAGEASDPPPV